jgi:hypothetical protein
MRTSKKRTRTHFTKDFWVKGRVGANVRTNKIAFCAVYSNFHSLSKKKKVTLLSLCFASIQNWCHLFLSFGQPKDIFTIKAAEQARKQLDERKIRVLSSFFIMCEMPLQLMTDNAYVRLKI